jgi:hypothetical protein
MNVNVWSLFGDRICRDPNVKLTTAGKLGRGRADAAVPEIGRRDRPTM